jgi:hypothetical protein
VRRRSTDLIPNNGYELSVFIIGLRGRHNEQSFVKQENARDCREVAKGRGDRAVDEPLEGSNNADMAKHNNSDRAAATYPGGKAFIGYPRY